MMNLAIAVMALGIIFAISPRTAGIFVAAGAMLWIASQVGVPA